LIDSLDRFRFTLLDDENFLENTIAVMINYFQVGYSVINKQQRMCLYLCMEPEFITWSWASNVYVLWKRGHVRQPKLRHWHTPTRHSVAELVMASVVKAQSGRVLHKIMAYTKVSIELSHTKVSIGPFSV